MGSETKYEIAKKRADEIDEQIINTLCSGKSFRVEAGAGSGKTYSLMKVIDWLQDNRSTEYSQKGKQVICITYTNIGVDTIKKRLHEENMVVPSTIHAFAWESMSVFQKALIEGATELALLPSNVRVEEIKKVSYTLGSRYYEKGTLYLYHDDVIKLFVRILDSAKFRRILYSKYPIILIDEYQDSFQTIMDQFLRYFIQKGVGPQFGLFGDSWQTIYASNGACGLVEADNITVIKKESNFRSQQVIVDVLNKIRPELPQISATDENDGRVFVITTNDYSGERISRGYYKGELANKDLQDYICNVSDKLDVLGWQQDKKILMLTHKLLSKQQHYENLLNILGDHLKDKDDPHLLFFENVVEPVFFALNHNDMQILFQALGIVRQPITSKAEKKRWLSFLNQLTTARNNSIQNVIECIVLSKLIPVPPQIEELYYHYIDDNTVTYHNKPVKEFYDIPYDEVVNVLEYQKPEGLFSTQHGVKGDEYDNVLLVLGRGWNNYRFEEQLFQNPETLSGKELETYVRNRNLFYVCCSRPRKRLALFITVEISSIFRKYLETVFGKDNIFSYSEFLSL